MAQGPLFVSKQTRKSMCQEMHRSFLELDTFSGEFKYLVQFLKNIDEQIFYF